MASTDSKTPSSSVPDPMATTEPEPSYSVSYPLFSTSPIPPASALPPTVWDSTSSETPISPASALPPTVWDVFISFHGKDTRYKFTSHLYQRLVDHGITTFMDDPELRTGEVISDALIEAIQKSKIYVVVLSENFASSGWCLNELVEIAKCYQPTKRLVVGVYCNIQPTAVRRQTGSFEQAFKNHDTRVAEMDKVAVDTEMVKEVAVQREKVKRWRLTLTNVAAFSGKPVSDQRSEADIINEIVDVVLLEIKPKTLFVAEHPVGLDPRVNVITKLLNSCTKEGVIIIGLFGMGGVGKSTLAKAVYNQLLPDRTFKGSCYLAEVREASRRAGGLVSLQQQLLDDVLRSKKKVEVRNVDEGTLLIRDRICSEKVLVLIDDIDDHKQYKSLAGPFASGSVVIVTTRNEEILETIGVESKYRYRVNVLDDAESRTLFIQHAFGHAEPDSRLKDLVEEILSLADRLPLALEVFGAYLRTESDEAGWKSYIYELERNPDNDIQEKLLISFNALKSRDLKNVFLDIACFFIEKKRQDVVDIMKTYYPYVDHNIDTLKKRCLLTIDDDSHTLKMHELLRNMGREVARNNSPDEPGKHSRLWVSEDICNVLKKHTGTAAIEGIIPSNLHYHGVEGISFETATFKSMSILRFLYIKNVDLSGSFERTFENLRWLQWESCPLEYLPSDFCPEKLVLLALRSSKMRTMWKLNMDPQVFKNLKTLDMSNSLDLTKGPDFTKLPCLETLNLEGCKSLVEVHVSIGWLASLGSLNLRFCVVLRSLPDNICNLRALKLLDIGGCSSLKALPIELGNIESLTELNAWGLATVSKIPDSIIHLSNLHKLNLSDYEYGTPSPTSWDIPFPTSWDVFISFRGKDTRRAFTSHLRYALDNHGVRAFRDDPALEGREVISNGFFRAVQESKTYIVVLSENYARSPWCLEELGEILNSHKTMERSIIVVFYHIEPSDVRYQKGSFDLAFKYHEWRYKDQVEKVNKWRRTLAEVADFSGWVVSDRFDEFEVISQVVNTVLLEISPIGIKVPKYPVGLNSRVEDVTELLSSDTQGVMKIGLYGMGGVGKSTLAKALYNQLLLRSFNGKCFLANVREISRTTKGLVPLQQQLINDVLGTTKVQVDNVDQGSKMIRSIVCLARVLVVIDDLDDHKQFESLVGPFASGSVVIVTTRYEEILEKIGVESKYRYRVNVLDDAESLQLFTRHAFGNDIPDKKLLELSKVILHHAGRHPGALISWGSHLYKKSEAAWKYYIEKHIYRKDFIEWGVPFPTSWDVFLSFRGLDTRHAFTSHLYHALRRHGVTTFMDDPLLASGEVISDALLQAIRESKTYIVVFSENYASSPWCLDELVEILNSYKTMERSIIVVFYHIEPSDVRYQRGSFNADFEKHEWRYKDQMEKVNKWRRTLAEVAWIPGWVVSDVSDDEADIISKLVNTVLLKIKSQQ